MASKEEVRRVSIYINGAEAELSLKQIEKGAAKLNAELKLLIPGTDAFKKKMQELKETRGVLKDIQDDIKGVGGAFGWLKTEIGKLGILAAGYMGFEFITSQFKNIISQNAKLADSISDIQKTTGLSETAVRKLQQSFKEIDTRSSRAELTDLAIVAGKLGISGEKDILGFVRAADQINVALGKDLGNAEQAINDLGKLTDLFKLKDEYGLEQALLKTGSAINDLGAAGSGNEGYIVEFVKKMGGIAPAAKISMQNVMGLAATMDELGQPVEASTTAIGQFLISIGQDMPRFAKLAGMSLKDFTTLVQKDGNQALISILQNLRSTGRGVEGLAASMGLIGEEGARATAALGVLTGGLDKLKERQELANKSFEKGTSLTAEYDVKNNNFAATLDKLNKKFNSLVSNATVTGALVGATEAIGKLIDGINNHMDAITNTIKILIVAGSAWVTYTTYMLLANSAQFKFIAGLIKGESLMALSRTATIALAGAKALFTGNLTKAAQAMRLLNLTMAANPIGAMVAALAAVITAVVLFKDSTTAAAKAQETLNKIKSDAVERVSDETDRLKALSDIITDNNEKYEKRIAAIKTLRSLTPDHLKAYTDEELLAGKASGAIKEYIKSLEKRAEAEVAFEELKRLKAEERQLMKDDGGVNFIQGVGVVLTDMLAGSDSGQKFYNKSAANNKSTALQSNRAQQQAIKDEYSPEIKDKAINQGGTGTGGTVANLKITQMTVDQLRAHIEKLNQEIAQTVKGTPEYKKVAAELTAANKQMKAIEKDTGKGGNGNGISPEDAKKAFMKKSSDLSQLVDNFNEEQLAKQQSKNEKEILDTEHKYDVLIQKAQNFQKEIKDNKKLSPKEKADATQKHQDEIDQLRIDKQKAVDSVILNQEQELADKIRDLRIQLGEVYETERQTEEQRINAFYDDLMMDAANSYEEWETIEANRAKDLADAKIREEKRFANEVENIEAEGMVDDAKRSKTKLARIDKHYDAEITALKKKYSKELQETEKFQKALEKIEKNRAKAKKKAEKEDGDIETKDIIAASAQVAQTVADAVFDIKKQNRDAETEVELANIDKQREKELSNKNLTEAQKKAINDKYDKQAADVKLKAWQADKEANIQRAIINGALAVGMALATTPWPLNFVMAGVAAATAAAEVIVIANTKPPKFEEGGYSAVDYKKPKGWVKSPTLFTNSASGRSFTAGENYKTEYIISSEQLKDPVIADFVGAMEANRTVRRFEAGGYSNATVKTVKAKSVSTSTDTGRGDTRRISALEGMMAKQLQINANQAKINEIPVVINTTTFDEQVRKNALIKTQAGAGS